MKRNEINIDRPEEYFKSDVLRKGFSMFQRNLVEFNGKENSLHYFFVGSKKKEEITLSLSKNKVLKHSCTCEILRCAHVCAAVFFLRKENYSSEEAPVKISDANESLYKKNEKIIHNIPQVKESFRSLIEFASHIRPQKNRINFLLSAVIYHLRGRNLKLREEELELLYQSILAIKIKKENAAYLFFTVKESLKSQQKFDSEIWLYLLPFLLRFQDHLMREELKNLFVKRTSKAVFPGNIDKRAVGMNLLLSVNKSRKDNLSAEYFIPLAMRAFAEQRIKKAFEVLEKGYEVLKAMNTVSLGAYIQFVIDRAVEHEKKSIEIKFLKEYFLTEPFISSSVFPRLSVLLSKQERAFFYEDVISALKNKRETQGKIFEILFHEKRWPDLINEIKRSKGKFNLLNKVALEMLPEITEDLLKIYPDFLVNAINSAGDGHYRTFLYDESKKFITNVPEEKREILVRKIIDKLGGKHHLVKGFLEMLNPPA